MSGKLFTPRPSHVNNLHKVLPSKMFLKEKFDAKGHFQSLKARLVVGGHMQDEIDSLEKYAPIVSIESLLIALQLHAVECNFMKINKRLASILRDMGEINDDLINSDGTCLVKLNRALYGLQQSGNCGMT